MRHRAGLNLKNFMSTKLMKFFQNPHEAAEKEQSIQLAEERLRMKLTEELEVIKQPYSKSRRPYYKSAIALSHLGNFYSFLTGAFCGGFLLVSTMGFLPPILAIVLAGIGGIIGAGLLEYGKRVANNRFWFYATFLQRFDLSGIVAVAILMAISIGSSFYTATLLPSTFTAPPPMADVDSVKNYYDKQLAEKKALAKDITEKGLWKGTITGPLQLTLKALQGNMSELETKRDSAIAAANIKNETTLLLHNAETSNKGWVLGWVTLGSELLFVFCFFYQKRYLYKCAKERKMFSESHNAANEQNIFEQHPIPNTDPGQRPIIGFFLDNKNEAESPVITPTYEQKIIIKNTAKHVDKVTGETKELSSSEIQKSINTYTDRVLESIEKLRQQAGDEQQKTLQALSDRWENLVYWHSKRDEILKNLEKMLP